MTFCLRLQGADLYLRVRPASENKQRDGEKEREGEGESERGEEKRTKPEKIMVFITHGKVCSVFVYTWYALRSDCLFIFMEAALFSQWPRSLRGMEDWVGGGGVVLYDVPRLSGGPHPSARPLPGYDLSVSPTHGRLTLACPHALCLGGTAQRSAMAAQQGADSPSPSEKHSRHPRPRRSSPEQPSHCGEPRTTTALDLGVVTQGSVHRDVCGGLFPCCWGLSEGCFRSC